METFDDILRAIESADDIIVGSHARPDGDAIGSAVAMGLLLRDQGKRVSILNCDPVPEALRFLPGIEEIREPTPKLQADLVIALDSADAQRLGEKFWQATADCSLVLNIDHHISNTEYGQINYVDSGSPATGQIVFQLARHAGWSLNQEIAENLYAAISTDTGSFRYPSTTSETMRIAGELIEAGVNPGESNRLLYENYPRRRVEMLRYMLDGMLISDDGTYACFSLPLSVSRELQLQTGDTEGVIDTIRAIDTVVIAVLFEELPDGKIRVSSRSKSEQYSVGALCGEFGGGGHTLAAGARLPGPLEEAQNRFMSKVAALVGAK